MPRAFPPLPVGSDLTLWTRASGLFGALEREPHPRAAFADEWDERYESLVEAETIDGTEFPELSATGPVFHDTFRDRFRTARDQVLAPPPAVKRPPKLTDHGAINRLRGELTRFLPAVTEVPPVLGCEVADCNPDLPEPTRFRVEGDEGEGSDTGDSAAVKFRVDATAVTEGQRAAVVAALNEWLAAR